MISKVLLHMPMIAIYNNMRANLRGLQKDATV